MQSAVIWSCLAAGRLAGALVGFFVDFVDFLGIGFFAFFTVDAVFFSLAAVADGPPAPLPRLFLSRAVRSSTAALAGAAGVGSCFFPFCTSPPCALACTSWWRSGEHTSGLHSPCNIGCPLLP